MYNWGGSLPQRPLTSSDPTRLNTAAINMIDAHVIKQAVVTYDDQGDLRLEVGQHMAKRSFIICSRALARVSKPFKAMLYGDFAESKSRIKEPNWTVELPKDDPRAFSTILHIVHSHFGMIPDIITRDAL